MVYFPGMFTGVGTAAVLSTGVFATAILRICRSAPRAERGHYCYALHSGCRCTTCEHSGAHHRQWYQYAVRRFRRAILWALTIPLGLFSIFIGYRYFKTPTMAQIEAEMPRERKNFIMPYVPLIVVVAIFMLIRIFPGKFPDIITPMVFMVGSIVGTVHGQETQLREGKQRGRPRWGVQYCRSPVCRRHGGSDHDADRRQGFGCLGCSDARRCRSCGYVCSPGHQPAAYRRRFDPPGCFRYPWNSLRWPS